MIKVIVICDIKIYCEGLKQILSQTDPIEVVGAEGAVDAALMIIEKHSPDVILLDMTMADSSSTAQKVMEICPDAKIVALAVAEDETNIIECAEAGIVGYVAREASLKELIDTVIGAKNGEFCCPPQIAACIFKKIQSIALNAKKKYSPMNSLSESKIINGLTKRERQIIMLMVKGLSNKQIASNLIIEVSTVKNHVHNILVKLNASNRTQVVTMFQYTASPYRSRSLDLDPGLKLSH